MFPAFVPPGESVYNKNKGVKFTPLSLIPPHHEAVAAQFKGEDGVMKMHLGKSVDGPRQYILDIGLGGCGD